MGDRTGRLVAATALMAWGLVAAASAPLEASPNEWLQAGPLVATAVRAARRTPLDRAVSPQPPVAMLLGPEHRPALLLPLYASFLVLQAMDAHSTLASVQRGYGEVNPLVAAASHSTGVMVATKLATSTATIVGAEYLWRRHRVAAVVAMFAINAGYAVVVAHNYRNLSARR
jgi:Domain of unknown function (DUF5658)